MIADRDETRVEPASWDEMPHSHRGGRPTGNPFLEPVAELIRSMPTDARGVPNGRSEGLRKITLSNDETTVNRHLQWLYRAGQKHKITVKKEIVENDDATVTIYFWTAPKITRNRS